MPSLSLSLLGPFQVTLDERSIMGVESGKVRDLWDCLKYRLLHSTADSTISKRFFVESILARQPTGIVNCGAVCPKSISVIIGNENPRVHSTIRSRSDCFSASE